MNIQTILDKLTDDLTHYTEVINTIPAYQGIQEFDKVWNGVKDSLTSMLDSIQEEMLYRGGLFEENETLKDRGAYNQAVERDRLIINSHR